MTDVSIIIPSRNERFLNETVRDLLEKMTGDTEIIVMLEGYWPDEVIRHPALHYIHSGTPLGMRGALNAGVSSARGHFVMKLDAHCMVSPGFDTVLANTCQDDWVCVPTRHRLDPLEWKIIEDGRPPINYQYITIHNDSLDGKEWHQKNVDPSLNALVVDDLISAQGSCYFLARDRWFELDLLDAEHYGTFRKDPQEVIFKNWTYGGRCVRVKSCWYAHLHKGKQFGRMYSSSRSDWQKGDEYVKLWWTDQAWPEKQRIPLRDIFVKFYDMPGWEDHEWMRGRVQAPAPDNEQLPRLYQCLTLPNGQAFTRPQPDKQASKFWDEGKWNTFIKPLLSADCTGLTFVEMGSNAGLFLKMAVDAGFSRVVGIEKDQTPVRIGNEYRLAIGYDYTLLKRKLGGTFHEDGTFNFDELPVADFTLLSTFHYYIDLNTWVKYLDGLRGKTRYVIIVSRPDMDNRKEIARSGIDAVRWYFRGWDEMGTVEFVEKSGDSKPRDLYAILFRNPELGRIPIGLIKGAEVRGYPMHEARRSLADSIAAGKHVDPFDTDYFRAWIGRKGNNPRWSDRSIRMFVQLKIDVMKDVMKNGLRTPLLVNEDRHLCDGGHRLAMLKAMGETSVMVREVC